MSGVYLGFAAPVIALAVVFVADRRAKRDPMAEMARRDRRAGR
jgi:heme exporter protein D